MLKNKDFKFRYSTGRLDIPIDFFELALSNSISLDLGLGYFSSACFNVLSTGFAHFISSGGNMRLYINQFITEDDYKLLMDSPNNIDFEERILTSFISLKKTFTYRDNHFFRCLSFLINQNRIEIKIVIPKDGGLAHEKFGLFKDENNDKVSFTGSMNMTASALLRNIETIDCFCSWKSQDNFERIEQCEKDFSDIWDGNNNSVTVFSATKFCQEIRNSYPVVTLDDLLVEEKEIIRNIANRNKTIDEPKLKNNLPKVTPHFPIKYSTGAREYQKDAYSNWVNNKRKGVFAMATGTGKTITSLNCALEEYKISTCDGTKEGSYKILILVPTIALVEQWIEEVNQFDFKNIITVYSQNSQWRKELLSLKSKLNRGKNESFVIISTYQSFSNDDFQKILKQLPDNMLLIADEAHNIGSESIREIFRDFTIQNRIALSATPNRIYDEEGTFEIEGFFNDKAPYVYNFSMEKAIKEKFLMEYCYYPKIVYLNDVEMDKYVEFTKLLMNLFDSKTGLFKDEQKAKKYLMLRKQVLHKAENKIQTLKNIVLEIQESKDLKYCFVYVPEGKEDKEEGEMYFTDEDSENLINKMLQSIREVSPKTTCNVYTGEINKTDRKAILKGFSDGKIDVLLAMKCLDEGVDIPRAEIGIFASSTGNPRQFIQRRGRLLRKHDDKNFAYIYDMIVVPNFRANNFSKQFYEMERSLVRGELSRVAYFASLATNTHFATESLKELSNYYNLSLSELILSINQ